MIELDRKDIEIIGEKRFWRKQRRRAYRYTAIMGSIACGLFIWLLFSNISGPGAIAPLIPLVTIFLIWMFKMWRFAAEQEKAGKELGEKWVAEGSPQPGTGGR